MYQKNPQSTIPFLRSIHLPDTHDPTMLRYFHRLPEAISQQRRNHFSFFDIEYNFLSDCGIVQFYVQSISILSVMKEITFMQNGSNNRV